MYKNNFVMAIKANGKVLREFEDTTYIPFGSEYSILLKNLDPKRKVKVTIHIDGQDALDGTSMIIDPKSELDLKRFIKNGNLSEGNAFKFIEKTEKIEQFRGNRAEDGLITVKYEFQRLPVITVTRWNSYPYGQWNYNDNTWYETMSAGNPTSQVKDWHEGMATMSFGEAEPRYKGFASPGVLRGATSSCSVSDQESATMNYMSNVAQNTAGITAPGSVTQQQFRVAEQFYGDGNILTMTVQLKGGTPEGKKVTKEVAVKKLVRCSVCGTNVRQTAKFCHECGASVQIV